MPNTTQTVVISGASSGIGEACAYHFARKNFNLLLLGRSEERLEKVKKECLALSSLVSVETISSDLRDLTAEQFLKPLVMLPSPTILINNAGIYHYQEFESTDLSTWNDLFQINLLGSIKLTQWLWPVFKDQRKGSIVNISSTLGIKPTVNTSAYSALKAAMNNWTLNLAQEGGSYNIRANAICPGIIDTPLHPFHTMSSFEKQETHKNILSLQLLSEIGHADSIAEGVYFLATETSAWTTGTLLTIDGGIQTK